MFPLDLFYFKLILKLQKGFMQICSFLQNLNIKIKLKYPAPAELNNESEDSNDTKQNNFLLCSTQNLRNRSILIFPYITITRRRLVKVK